MTLPRTTRRRRGYLAASALGLLPVLSTTSTACNTSPSQPTVEVTAKASSAEVDGLSVVTNGAFRNIYVYPHSDPSETWDQHLASLAALGWWPNMPSNISQYSQESIDAVTQRIMTDSWPAYTSLLYQYSGVNPPQFFGSGAASIDCVNAAISSTNNGVLQWDGAANLANCAVGGDQSPQVNLIFSPDFPPLGDPKDFFTRLENGQIPAGAAPNMCLRDASGNFTDAYHASMPGMPNFTAIPTSTNCNAAFSDFTVALSHEIDELLSDPAGFGYGGIAPDISQWGNDEVGDLCQNTDRSTVSPAGDTLTRYWSDDDQNCQPRLDAPSGSAETVWVVKGDSSDLETSNSMAPLAFGVPADRVNTNALVTQVSVVLQNGGYWLGDDYPSGTPGQAIVTLNTHVGDFQTVIVVDGNHPWTTGTTHSAILANLPSGPGRACSTDPSFPVGCPAGFACQDDVGDPGQTCQPALHVSDITGVTLSTNSSSWSVTKAALVVSYPTGSALINAPAPTTVPLIDAQGIPLVRFTGSVHDQTVFVDPTLVGMPTQTASLVIYTGNDDLRGGSTCDVTVGFADGKSFTLSNVNQGQEWNNWTVNTVPITVPAGHSVGDIRSVDLHTNFAGGCCGDNWNVARVQLLTSVPAPVIQSFSPTYDWVSGGDTITITGANFEVGQGTKIFFGNGAIAANAVCSSSTRCTATIPAGTPGQTTVSVEVAGAIAQGPYAFDYVALPIPVCSGSYQCAGANQKFGEILFTCQGAAFNAGTWELFQQDSNGVYEDLTNIQVSNSTDPEYVPSYITLGPFTSPTSATLTNYEVCGASNLGQTCTPPIPIQSRVCTCVPNTCASLNYCAGTYSDGCGGTLTCTSTSCPTGEVCSQGSGTGFPAGTCYTPKTTGSGGGGCRGTNCM